MQGTQPRWLRTLYWISLGGGVMILLLAAIFSAGLHNYALAFSVILSSTAFRLFPRWPRLAYVCGVLGFAAAIAYIPLLALWLRR